MPKKITTEVTIVDVQEIVSALRDCGYSISLNEKVAFYTKEGTDQFGGLTFTYKKEENVILTRAAK
jgi:hypothetical protein